MKPLVINWYCAKCDRMLSSQDVSGMAVGKATCRICKSLVERKAVELTTLKRVSK